MVGMRGAGRVQFADDAEPEDPWGADEQPHSIQATGAPQHPQQIQQQAPTVQQRHSIDSRHGAIRQTSCSAPLSALDRFRSSKQSSVNKPGTAASKARQHLFLSQDQQHIQHIPSLQKLCLGVLGRHITQLVEQLDGQLGFLPADVKAALLAVARRRAELTSRVLAALADPEWTQLDLSHCRQLCAAEVLQAAPLMPNIQVLDVIGFDQLAAGGWKQFARAWPALSVLRLGGSQICSQQALKALPHILPGITQPAAPAAAAGSRQEEVAVVNSSSSSSSLNDTSSIGHPAAAAAEEEGEEPDLGSWEDVYDSDTDEQNNISQQSNTVPPAAAAAAAGQDCRLKNLRVLVWPDVAQEAVDLVQQRCPKVRINPPMKRDKVTGLMPPQELDGSVALDQRFMEFVSSEALQQITNQPSYQQRLQQQQDGEIIHIADRFKLAYIQQDARLREKERRLRQQEQRRQLRSSHALRTLETWLDEPA